MEPLTIIKKNFSSLGGLEKQTNKIIAHFAKKRPLHILTTSKMEDRENVSFHQIKVGNFFQLLQFDSKSSSWINRHKSKKILGMDRTTNQTHLRLGNGIHKAYLQGFFFKSLIPKQRELLYLEKKALSNEKLEKVIANSNMVKEELIYYYDLDPKKIEVIHNGVEYYDYEKSFEDSTRVKLELQKTLKLEKEIPLFLFVGNGFKRKGLDILIKALSQLKEEFYLIVIGEDRRAKEFKKLCSKLNLADRIFFLGAQKEVLPYYQLCDYFVLPSRYDPFSNSVLEALAMGLFVVTSFRNGAKEIINDTNGIICDLSIDSLITALQRALFKHKSTKIRESVKHLNIDRQLLQLEMAIYG